MEEPHHLAILVSHGRTSKLVAANIFFIIIQVGVAPEQTITSLSSPTVLQLFHRKKWQWYFEVSILQFCGLDLE